MASSSGAASAASAAATSVAASASASSSSAATGMSALGAAAIASVDSVPSFSLTGHTRSVLCLATARIDSEHPHLLLSGSEDSTCRVWDVRVAGGSGGGAVKCLKAFGAHNPAVTSVSFGHPTKQPHAVFVAAERGLFRFDLRAPSVVAQVVVREAQHAWPTFAEDEINQIHVHPTSGNYLAAADDSGEVHIMDLQQQGSGGALYKTLSGKHSNLCSAVQFRPKQTWEVWSGGMDSQVCVWDFSRGRCTHQLSMQSTAASAAASSSNQTLNPPFVNSLSFTRDGDTALAASGNGEIVLWDARRKVERRRLLGHTHSVMHVSVLPLPPSFCALSSFAPAPTPSCLLSAGNDQTLLLWDLQALLAESSAVAPAAAAASASSSSTSAAASRNQKKKAKAKAKKAAASPSSAAGVAEEEEQQAGDGDEENDESSELALDQLSLGSGASSGASSSSSNASSSSRLPAFSSPWLPASAAYSAAESAALPDSRFVRFRWRHPRKINALATSAGMRDAQAVLNKQKPSIELNLHADGSQPLCTSGVCVYVADTDTAITAYHLR